MIVRTRTATIETIMKKMIEITNNTMNVKTTSITIVNIESILNMIIIMTNTIMIARLEFYCFLFFSKFFMKRTKIARMMENNITIVKIRIAIKRTIIIMIIKTTTIITILKTIRTTIPSIIMTARTKTAKIDNSMIARFAFLFFSYFC